jgi:uncharacterized protein YwgA
MPNISRHQLLLLLLGIGDQGESREGIGGITRLQKFLFLLEKEEKLTPTANGFEFTAYKAGPYSAKLYDELELLENLDLIKSDVVAEASEAEAAEIEELSFEDLMGDAAEEIGDKLVDGFGAADAFEERRFSLTENGLRKVKEMIESGEYKPIVDGIRKIKSKYGHYSLSDLLYYVYTKFPEMTTESEIKEKVLSRRRKYDTY